MENPARPTQISGHDSSALISETKKTREIASTHRVYRKEWLYDSRHEDFDAAEITAAVKYAKRLREEDIEIRRVGEDYELWTRRWNVAGEWKWSHLAEKQMNELLSQGDEVEVVARNSRREHELKNYGILKLAT